MDPLAALMSTHGDLPDLDAIINRPAWAKDGLCREPLYAAVNFFPGQGEDARPAKAVCARCLVREECAAAGAGEAGIWGGLSGRDRRSPQQRELGAAVLIDDQRRAFEAWARTTERPSTRAYRAAYRADRTLPSPETIIRHLGTWSAAVAAARAESAAA